MKKDDQCQRLISIGAAILFAAIALVVLVAFEPARDLLCARYDARGIGGLIATFAGQDPSCLRNFLYDYQTLITGILAVVAAMVTVKQMREADMHARLPGRLALERLSGRLKDSTSSLLTLMALCERHDTDLQTDEFKQVLVAVLQQFASTVTALQTSEEWKWVSYGAEKEIAECGETCRRFVARLNEGFHLTKDNVRYLGKALQQVTRALEKIEDGV